MTNVIAPRTNVIASGTNGDGLLSCPFCGGEAELVEGDYGMFMTGYAVYCKHCCTKVGVTGRLGEAYEWVPIYDTEAEAIAAWNARAEDAATVEMAQRIQSLELECAKLSEGLRKAGK